MIGNVSLTISDKPTQVAITNQIPQLSNEDINTGAGSGSEDFTIPITSVSAVVTSQAGSTVSSAVASNILGDNSSKLDPEESLKIDVSVFIAQTLTCYFFH